MMFIYVREVEATDNWRETLYQILRGIQRYSFMQMMPDSRRYYAEWYNRYVGYQANQVDQAEQHITTTSNANT